jgi:hypothetical protein
MDYVTVKLCDVGVGDGGMAPLFVRGGSHKWSTRQVCATRDLRGAAAGQRERLVYLARR